MTRRLLYHFFWNFYDYLGSYLLFGAGGGIAVLLLLWVGSLVWNVTSLPAVRVVVLGVVVFACTLILIGLFAGTFGFAVKAAQEQPARIVHFKQSVAALFGRYTKLLILLALAATLIAVNIVFYQRFAAVSSPGLRSAFFVASMLFVWIMVAVIMYSQPLLATAARFPEQMKTKQLLRKAFIYFALAPGFWFISTVLFGLIAFGCLASLVGTLFLVPLLAAQATSALEIVVQYAENLGRAKEELGQGRSLSQYRKRAAELGWEWELQQPRRGFRDLIKPWEM